MFDLKQRRIELGLTMLDVAKLVGVSEATISRYESGNIRNMRRDRIEKYAKALQISPIVLLGIDDDYIETHEFLKTIGDSEHTSQQVKEHDAYIDELIEEYKWDKESEKFEKEAEYRYKALDKALIPYVPDPKERGMATSIVQQFPRLNLNGLMMLNNRIEELVRFDECISDIEKESRSAGH